MLFSIPYGEAVRCNRVSNGSKIARAMWPSQSATGIILCTKARRRECAWKVATLAGWVFGNRLTVFIFAPPMWLLPRFSRIGKER